MKRREALKALSSGVALLTLPGGLHGMEQSGKKTRV